MISCRDWRQADAFASGLRCGMSIEDVRARARSLGASKFIADGRVPILYGTHVAAEGSSRVYLSFAGSRLQWVRSGSQAGPWTGMRMGLKRDLCSGRELVSLIIHGSPRWERATVTINGTVAGTLSSEPSALLETDVPVGRNYLVISTRESTYRKVLSFDRNSQGVVQIDVPD
jgi:hypothetical protein